MSFQAKVQAVVSSVLSRSPSLPQYSYRAVVGNDSSSSINETKTESEHDRTLPRRKRWSLWAPLGLCVCLVLAVIVVGVRSHRAELEFPSFSPTFPTYPLIFRPNSTFAAPPSPESNAAWDALIPEGHGYVLVPDDAEQYGLGPGIGTDEGADMYAVSLYHQIHCLSMIRLSYFSSSPAHSTHSSHNARPDHIAHCFDYLRQSLMCAGDMKIEHAMEPALGNKRVTTDGWGVTHQCRDWGEMEKWTVEHRADYGAAMARAGVRVPV